MRNKILIVYALAILLGLLFSIGYSLLNRFIMQILNYIYTKGADGVASVLISILFVFIAWLMMRNIALEASDSGVQEIEGALLHKRPIF